MLATYATIFCFQYEIAHLELMEPCILFYFFLEQDIFRFSEYILKKKDALMSILATKLIAPVLRGKTE